MSSTAKSTSRTPKPHALVSVRFPGNQVCAGFQLPADDLRAQRIDDSQVLIKHLQATYALKTCGHSMIEASIFVNKILVVDRAVKPRRSHVVLNILDGDLTMKYLHQCAEKIKLKAANPTFRDNLFNKVRRLKCAVSSLAASSNVRLDRWRTDQLSPTSFNKSASINQSLFVLLSGLQHVRPC